MRPTLQSMSATGAVVLVDGVVALHVADAQSAAATLAGAAFTDADGIVWQFSRATGDFEVVPAPAE